MAVGFNDAGSMVKVRKAFFWAIPGIGEQFVKINFDK